MEDRRLRASGQIVDQVGEAPIEAHHQSPDAEHDPEHQEPALEQIGPHQRLDATPQCVDEDEQDRRAGRGPEGNPPALEHEGLKDRDR